MDIGHTCEVDGPEFDSQRGKQVLLFFFKPLTTKNATEVLESKVYQQ